jgi:K+/H+ antiporter YhaU regulatory subunit KhtT
MFRITGLPDDKARFQVLSILTGAGFTTRESESIVSSRMRRRLAQGTMLFGYVFNVTIVSALVNVFFSLKSAQVDTVFLGLAVPLAIAALVIHLIRTRAVRKRIDRILGRVAGRIMKQNKVNTILLMDYIGNDSIANVILKEVPEAFRGKTLAELELKSRYNIMVMLVERDGYKVEQATASTVFLPGDRLTVFGRYKTIVSVFQAYERFS